MQFPVIKKINNNNKNCCKSFVSNVSIKIGIYYNNNNNNNNKKLKKRFPSPTVKMHLLVFLTDILFLMSQSTRTPPDGPTNALTTYGKAAKNPVCVQRFDYISFTMSQEIAAIRW